MAMRQPANDDADLPLIEALMRGEPRGLRELMRRHERWVRGVAYGITGRGDLAEDVAQQVWATVWQQIATLRDPARWRGWLYQLTRRAAIDAGKQRKRRADHEVSSEDAAVAAPAPTAAPDAKLIADEGHRQVMEAIRSLPPIYREPFVLKHLEDWSYARIGEVLELPVDTVETRLVRARRMLRETLQGVAEDATASRR